MTTIHTYTIEVTDDCLEAITQYCKERELPMPITSQQPELNIFKSLFPNHKVKYLNAGHFWQDEKGELAAQYIKDWALEQGWITNNNK